MSDAQITEKVTAVPEVQSDHGKEPEPKFQEVASEVSAKKQSLSDIFTIVSHFQSPGRSPPRH